MGGFKIEGLTGTVAEVDAQNQQKVTLPQTATGLVGLAGTAAVVHDGVTGAARLVRAGEVSANRRLRVGVDNLIFMDQFSYAAQNTANYANTLTTMTVAYGGGYLTLNNGASTANAAVARVSTYHFWPLINGSGLALELDGIFTQAFQTNNVIEFGWFQAATTAAPTDGVLFRITSGGAMVGVMNYNGSETTTANFTAPTPGVDHSYQIQIESNEVSFWIDGSLQDTLAVPAGQSGPTIMPYQPITIREYNSGVVSTAQLFKIGEIRLYSRDVGLNRDWSLTQADMGGNGSQGQNGQTQGSNALFTNSLAAGAGAAATNTTAALGSGLGGQFSLQPTLAVPTDGIISSFQVPTGTAAIPGRSLVINGVKISGVVTTAFTGGPVIGIWSLAYGHTALSLATAEGAAAKSPRRIPLGTQVFVVTAAVGAQGTPVDVAIQLQDPIMVNPGEFVQTVMKNAGTVTSAGVITFTVTFDSHWE